MDWIAAGRGRDLGRERAGLAPDRDATLCASRTETRMTLRQWARFPAPAGAPE
jgi:hypothetical protein